MLFEVGDELKKEYAWQDLTREQTFSAVISQVAYALSTIVTDNDFAAFRGNTIFDRTNNRWLDVVDIAQWQALNSLIGLQVGITKAVCIFEDALNIYPTPTATDTYVFNYVSGSWIIDSGSTRRADFTADTDTFIFNEEMLTLGLIYKLRQAYGLPYEDQLLGFQKRASAEAENNRIKQTISPRPVVGYPFANIQSTGFGP